MTVFIREADYETAESVVEGVFDEAVLDVAGKRVFVKPNVLGPFPPERGITTHPAVVRAVVRALCRRGAEVVVGDNPGMRGYGVNERCAAGAGIIDAAEGAWTNIGFEPVRVPAASRFANEFVVSRIVREADLFISLPKFKTHVSTVITGAIKNSYGCLVGGQKARLHRLARGAAGFAEAVVDVFAIRPPDFVVMDGIVAMQGKGPSSHDLRPLGLVLAGTNAVEVDAVMAAVMGVRPADVGLLREAHRRGLGEIDTGRLDIRGRLEPVPDYKVPFLRKGRGVGVILARLLTYLAVGRPTLRKDACVKCGVCGRQCPVNAITLDPYPMIDEDKCVLCYCCNEFCEQDAMDVSRRMRFFRRR